MDTDCERTIMAQNRPSIGLKSALYADELLICIHRAKEQQQQYYRQIYWKITRQLTCCLHPLFE